MLARLTLLETGQLCDFEGTAKVQDRGGRHFTYWNPVNSINSCLVVNGPVSIALTAHNNSNDVELEHDPSISDV